MPNPGDENGNGIQDPWEPHWLDDGTGAIDRAPLQSVFAGVHPDDQLHPDTQIPLIPGIGIPEHLFGDIPTPDENEAAQGAPPEATEGEPGEAPLPPPGWALSGVPQPAPEMPPAPDAISGGALPELSPLAEPGSRHAEQYADDPLSNPNEAERDAVMQRMAVEDPAAFQDLQIKRDLAAAHDLATQQLAESTRSREAAQRNFDVRKAADDATAQKMATLDAHVGDLMARKIDPRHYMSSRSAGRVLIDILGGFAGGMAAQGGPNQYLALMQRRVDEDIDAQKFNLENERAGIGMQRGLVAEEYARTGDLYQATEAVRIAAHASLMGELLTQQQLRDPRGTQAIALGQAAQGQAGRIAQAQQAYEAQSYKRSLEVSEERRKWAETSSKVAKEQAETSKLAAKGTGVGKTPRPIVMPITSWMATNHITTGGSSAQRAYGEYVANVQRAQAAWDSAARGVPVAAGVASSPATAPQIVGRAAAPVAQRPAPSQGQGPARHFESEDDWFEANAPAASDVDKKRYWFVDGKNGNDVPPIKIASISDPEKFAERQRIRRQMGVKADQLRMLVERLQKKGLWSTVKNKINWAQDDDALEARSLSEDLTGDAIQAKGMGVPSGNDVERIKTMMGGDPAGWRDPTPALQRARETMQVEQDADWSTAAPSAFDDPRYNKYRVLPTADPGWVEKLKHRGEIKVMGPEYGNTDPKQLRPVESKADAPNVTQYKASKETTANLAAAGRYLERSGAVAAADPLFDARKDDLLGADSGSSLAVPVPQVTDFPYKGDPDGADSFQALRTYHVNNVAVLNRYLQSHSPKDWAAFQAGEKLLGKKLPAVLRHSSEWTPEMTQKFGDPAWQAEWTGKMLRSGGK